jgi:CBS domain containing-hemolysin-like protein
MEDLQRRFDKVKGYMTEDLGRIPTDKEVYEQLRAIAVEGLEFAMMDDMQGYIESYQRRIKMIDEKLKSF